MGDLFGHGEPTEIFGEISYPCYVVILTHVVVIIVNVPSRERDYVRN